MLEFHNQKISFIIPAYNEEKYIATCLSSLIAELSGDSVEYEILVVNNASTDNTKDIALSFPKVTVIDEPRKGACFARQAGYLVATGELIANIDADTVIPAGWVSKVLKVFSQDEGLVAISGPQIFYDLSTWNNIWIFFYYSLCYFSYILNRFVFRSWSFLLGGNAVVKKSALDKVGGYSEQFEFYGDDTYLAKQLNRIGKVVFTFRLPIYASGRRLQAEGVFTMGIRYSLNYIWANVANKPFTKQYIDVRLPVGSKDIDQK